jgi:hypothetical protein
MATGQTKRCYSRWRMSPAEWGRSTYSEDCGITLFGVPQAAGSLDHSRRKVLRILGLPAVGRHKKNMLQNRTPTALPLSARAEKGDPFLHLHIVPACWISCTTIAGPCSPPGPSRKCAALFIPVRPTGQVQRRENRGLRAGGYRRVIGGICVISILFRDVVVCPLDSAVGMR